MANIQLASDQIVTVPVRGINAAGNFVALPAGDALTSTTASVAGNLTPILGATAAGAPAAVITPVALSTGTVVTTADSAGLAPAVATIDVVQDNAAVGLAYDWESATYTTLSGAPVANGAGPAPAANVYPLQAPAGLAAGAPVTLGIGPDQIVLAGACENMPTNEFSLVGVFGTSEVVMTGALVCTSQVASNLAGSQVFTVNADLTGLTGLIVQTVPGQQALTWQNALTVNGLAWVTDGNSPAVTSRSGTPLYGPSLFDNANGSALWLPPNDPRVIAAQPPTPVPPATLTQISGATINGVAATPDTLQNLVTAAAKAAAPITLLLPAGEIFGTATVPVAMTIGGVPVVGALGVTNPDNHPTTILDGTGVAPAFSKGALVPLVSGVVIRDMLIRNYSISAALGMNAAAVRNNGIGIDFALINVESTGNQDGILTGGGSVTQTNCYMHDNGAGPVPPADDYTHEGYYNPDVATDNTITLNQQTSACGTQSTHALKTRAAVTILNGGTFSGNPDPNPAEPVAGSVIDIPNGGNFTATGATFVIPAGAAIPDFLNYGMESVTPNPGNAVSLKGCIFNGNGKAGKLNNGPLVPTATLDVTGATYVGTAGPPVISGFASVVGTITQAPAP